MRLQRDEGKTLKEDRSPLEIANSSELLVRGTERDISSPNIIVVIESQYHLSPSSSFGAGGIEHHEVLAD